MGHFYTNFEIIRADPAAVLNVAKELGRTAFVISDANGNTLLFDAACDEQDVAEIERLGRELANRLHFPVVASLNHDDDHLLLWLFLPGRIVRYESCWHAGRFGWALSKVCGGVLAYPIISAILVWPVFIFQHLRHSLLTKFAGLSPLTAGLGYTYIQRGERPLGLSEDDVKRV